MNKISISLALAVSFFTANAQDPVVMEINGKPVLKSEFEAVYKKNSGKDVQNNTKSVKEYVDLFSLFKSKVFEAESLGLDTLTSFKNELSGYRRQLAAPYLTDKSTNDNLLHEAYDRLKTEVRASHILVRLPETALPKDTMEAYTRILLVRKAILGTMPTSAEIANYDKLLKNSTEVFYALKRKDSTIYKQKLNSIKNLADNYKAAGTDKFQDIALKTSDDPSVVDNKGDLNYFSALDMVYPFENAAYNTKIGDVSDVIKSKFGYHILKVYDKRAARGEITAEHIMAKFSKESTPDEKNNARKKIDELYTKLKAGSNFEDLARQFSDDNQTKDRGGLLQPFKSGRLPKEFEDAAFAIAKDGDYSQVVESPYGYHIIKRVSLKTVPPFDEIKNELKTRVNRDSRNQMGRSALIAKVKKENNFKENLKNRDELAKVVDSTYLKSTWKADNAKKLGNKEIFNLAGKSYTQMDFAKYLESQMTFRSPTDVVELMKSMYPNWVNEEVIKYEDSQLDKKYVDYKNLLREYRDGILLFDLTDQKVWSKAVRDSLGLNEYYNKNKNNYLWDERADVTTYKCLNEKIANDVRKQLKANKTEKEIVELINKSSQLNLSVENVTYLKGENKNVDANWKQGVAEKNSINDADKKVMVIVVNKISPKTPKTLGECRGLVTADYQNYLETEWINYLKNKYKVKVNEDVLNSIK
ncbi:MAG: peptidyl-prolyl cis-trans isomerase [Bacteroidetes bacterium]|nr:peptidyl-prolyl cis-trans isomerase [Bacteroidota bacterium]